MRRRGLSVLEAVVAIAVLAFSVAALIRFSSGESRAISMSEERLTAIMLLGEMQQTLNHRDFAFYSQFPARREQFDGLLETLVLELPTVFDPRDTTDTSQTAAELRATLGRMKARRYVLFEPIAAPEGGAGVVTYLVTYEARGEKGAPVPKEISTYEVVYREAPSPP